MKIFVTIFCTIILLSCTDLKQKEKTSDMGSQPSTDRFNMEDQYVDSSLLHKQFIELKNAITSNNRNALKSFIEFPIKNKGNEIWYIADSRLVMEIEPKPIKPFTESDFDKYFSSLFALDLRETLNELDTDTLFATGKSATPEIEVVKNTKSKLEANYNNNSKTITLTLISILQHNSKFTIAYEFDLTSDKKLKFKNIYAVQ